MGGDMADFIQDEMVFDDEFMAPDITGVNCQYCKKGPFYWHQDDKGKWRLYTETLKLHICKSYKKHSGL